MSQPEPAQDTDVIDLSNLIDYVADLLDDIRLRIDEGEVLGLGEVSDLVKFAENMIKANATLVAENDRLRSSLHAWAELHGMAESGG